MCSWQNVGFLSDVVFNFLLNRILFFSISNLCGKVYLKRVAKHGLVISNKKLHYWNTSQITSDKPNKSKQNKMILVPFYWKSCTELNLHRYILVWDKIYIPLLRNGLLLGLKKIHIQLNSVLYPNNHIQKSSKIIFNGLVLKDF